MDKVNNTGLRESVNKDKPKPSISEKKPLVKLDESIYRSNLDPTKSGASNSLVSGVNEQNINKNLNSNNSLKFNSKSTNKNEDGKFGAKDDQINIDNTISDNTNNKNVIEHKSFKNKPVSKKKQSLVDILNKINRKIGDKIDTEDKVGVNQEDSPESPIRSNIKMKSNKETKKQVNITTTPEIKQVICERHDPKSNKSDNSNSSADDESWGEVTNNNNNNMYNDYNSMMVIPTSPQTNTKKGEANFRLSKALMGLPSGLFNTLTKKSSVLVNNNLDPTNLIK